MRRRGHSGPVDENEEQVTSVDSAEDTSNPSDISNPIDMNGPGDASNPGATPDLVMPTRRITVSGTGTASAAADIATITIGVSLLGAGVVAATDEAAVKANHIIEALAEAGIDSPNIQTADYSVFAEMDHRTGEPVLRGYRVNNTLRITVRDLTRISEVLQKATAAGGDETTINGISFSLSDDTPVRASARDSAWANALTAATQLASLGGCALGPATSIQEGVGHEAPQGRMLRRSLASSAAATPIEAGETSVTVTLNVDFAAE